MEDDNSPHDCVCVCVFVCVHDNFERKRVLLLGVIRLPGCGFIPKTRELIHMHIYIYMCMCVCMDIPVSSLPLHSLVPQDRLAKGGADILSRQPVGPLQHPKPRPKPSPDTITHTRKHTHTHIYTHTRTNILIRLYYHSRAPGQSGVI